jgi:magnesium chelatase accessory protein
MMARWDIDMLAARLMALNTPTLLLYGDKDGTVPPRVSLNAAATMPNARAESLGDLGHLAHEETPARVADRISSWMDEVL